MIESKFKKTGGLICCKPYFAELWPKKDTFTRCMVLTDPKLFFDSRAKSPV